MMSFSSNNPDLGLLLTQAQDMSEVIHVLLLDQQKQLQQISQHNVRLQQVLLAVERRKAFRSVQNQRD